MKKIVILSLLAVNSLILSNISQASVLFSDNFSSYTNGNLVGQGGWAAFSAAGSTPVQVSGGSISLDQGAGSREDVDHDLGATLGTGDTWYYSMNVDVTANSSLVYFAMFLQGTGNFEGKLFVAPSTVGGDFVFGITGSASAAPTTWGTGLSFGTDYQIVVSYDFDTTNATLWVDPTSQSSTSVSNIGSFDDAATAIAFRQGTGSTSIQTIGNLIVGTTFGDVTPAPEPSSIALATLGGLGYLIALRRKR
jgi:hypothetical protein